MREPLRDRRQGTAAGDQARGGCRHLKRAPGHGLLGLELPTPLALSRADEDKRLLSTTGAADRTVERSRDVATAVPQDR